METIEKIQCNLPDWIKKGKILSVVTQTDRFNPDKIIVKAGVKSIENTYSYHTIYEVWGDDWFFQGFDYDLLVGKNVENAIQYLRNYEERMTR